MIKKILFILYINSFFRCCVFILTIGMLYDKKFSEEISFYRYFKKKKYFKKLSIKKSFVIRLKKMI